MTTATKTRKGLYVGRHVKFSAADGYAIYEIVSLGQKTVRLRWVNDPEENPDGYKAALGNGGTISRREVESLVRMEDVLDEIHDNGQAFFESLKPGDIVHYHHGFGEYVRCRVMADDTDVEKTDNWLKPIALVGKWKSYDLEWSSHYVKMIQSGQPFTFNMSNAYENGNPARLIDPRKLDPLPLTVKPASLSGTLHICCGDINVSAPTIFCESERFTTVGPVMKKLIDFLRDQSLGLHVEIKTEDGQIHGIHGINYHETL